MKAVLQNEFGGAETMFIGDTEKPVAKSGELLVKVEASAVNRADVLQRQGKYPPPPGVSKIIGLEISGTVEEIGESSDPKWKVGDRVIGIVSGGAYAQYCTIHSTSAIRLPESISFIDGAAIPESWMTAYQALYLVGRMENPEYVLIHAGASSLGVAAIQLVNQAGGKAIVTCGSQDKVEFCKQVGAFAAINYKEKDFAEAVQEITGGKGVNLLLDCVGADYFMKNLASIALDGALVIVGWLSGTVIPNCDLNLILRKRIRVEGTTLRNRCDEYKSILAKKVEEYCLPRFLDGRMKPVVDRIFPLAEIADAHKYLEANKNKGKVVIEIK